jgi:hypothetical protein
LIASVIAFRDSGVKSSPMMTYLALIGILVIYRGFGWLGGLRSR